MPHVTSTAQQNDYLPAQVPTTIDVSPPTASPPSMEPPLTSVSSFALPSPPSINGSMQQRDRRGWFQRLTRGDVLDGDEEVLDEVEWYKRAYEHLDGPGRST